MEDVVQAPSEHDDVRVLAACMTQAQDGIDLAYRVLDQMAEHRRLSDAALVVRPSRLGPQVFLRGRVPPAPELVTALLTRPAGLYAASGEVDPASQSAFAGCCELALDADTAGSAATTGLPRLASRPAVEVALGRAAARSARYGWPVTVLLLAGVGDGPAAQRWRALGTAVARSARVGDVVGAAGNARALVLLANAGADAVGPFVERVTAALAAAGTGWDAGHHLAWTTAALPKETVDPEEVWRLLDERMDERMTEHPDGAAPTVDGWTGGLPSELELELRSLPGVVAVGTSARGPDGGPQLTVVALDPSDALHARISRRVADRFGPDAVPLVTVGAAMTEPTWAATPLPSPATADGASSGTPTSPAPVPNGDRPTATGWAAVRDLPAERRVDEGAPTAPRVALLTARFDPDTGTTEVALCRGGARATGRASAGPLAGGVQATLAALGVLGVDVPFYLMSAERARGVPGEPVVVVLASRHHEHHENGTGGGAPRPGARIGVAGGEWEVEAASRATLGALNRFLAGERRPRAS